jgi:hypothetical protein
MKRVCQRISRGKNEGEERKRGARGGFGGI